MSQCRLPLLFAAAGALGMAHPAPAAAPQILPHDNFQNIVRFPNGQLWRVASRFNAVYHSISNDNGLTWQGGFTAPWKLFDAFGGLNPQPVVDAAGALHLFQPRRLDGGPIEFSVYHAYSNPELTNWNSGTLIHPGNTGSMLKVIQSSTGRFIIPIGDKAHDPPPGFGNSSTVVRYADAGTSSFTLSPSILQSPVPSNWNGASDGACEPTLIEKSDGSIWMLMRSQTGKLTESTSHDVGATWSPAVNSRFYTTSGPPCLVPMDNGDMVLLWNNATMPPRHDGKVWYAGRDVLHAAISQDDGATWKGFREIYLDPVRNQSPPTGDTGTAYPFATATSDNHIIALTGQAAAKAQLRIDPQWLLEKHRSDDFTANGALDNWSVFKPFGDVVSVKRDRVVGAHLIDDPDPARTKPVLHVRRPDDKDPDGAVWNFPSAARGRTHVRLKLQPGFAGGAIALTDRFFNPTDSQGENNAFYRLNIAPGGLLANGATVPMDQWTNLLLDWNATARTAIVRLNGVQVGTIGTQAGVEMWPGLSYLRLRSTAAAIDTAGFLVDQVVHEGSHFKDTRRLPQPELESALAGAAGWMAIQFDAYAPNLNASADNPSGNGATASSNTPYMGFVDAADSIGLVVESSTGTVTFTDATSSQVTSDLLGTKFGESLTLRFVDPSDPSRPATVSDVAFRLGSINADNVDIKLFDIAGEEMPDWLFSAAPAGVSGAIGFTALADFEPASLIHSIQLTSRTADVWLLGSFTIDPGAFDFAYRGFTTTVPEPAAAAVLLAATLLPRRRSRRS